MAPFADDDDTPMTDEDMPVDINILDGDTDDDGMIVPGSVVITMDPASGMVEVDPVTGLATYTPNLGSFGEDSFKYTVDDNEGATSNEATVTIMVDPINHGPLRRRW